MVRAMTEIPGKNGIPDERGISELFGYILLMGIVVAGLSFIIFLTMPTVESSKDAAQFNHIEQAFTTADSRISKARFSTSIYQETTFQLNEGRIVIDDSDANSYIEIYKETTANPPVYHATLGTIRCIIGDREVAYQNGGVWERYSDGSSIMISPPDFQYNGETLTLPIMSIKGSQSIESSSGNKAIINVQSRDPVPVYPDASRGTNPVEQGKDIIVVIKSDYYQAWADFIRERTKAIPTVDKDNKMVTAVLKTGSPTQSDRINKGMNTKQMETYNDYAPISKFTIHLEKRNPGKDYFLSIRPVGLDPTLNIVTDRVNGPGKDDVVLRFVYTDTTDPDPANHIYEAFSARMHFDGDKNDYIDINMLDSTQLLMYGDEDGDEKINHKDSNVNQYSRTWGIDETVTDTGTFTGITNGDDLQKGEYKTLADVTQHYLRLMATKHPNEGPVYLAYGSEKGNNEGKIHYNPQTSDFLLQFNSKKDLKYLYVTYGEIDASLSSSG